MIIGLTGTNGAGKGTVAEILIKKGFTYYSLSDLLREVLASRGILENRDNLINLGNELRKKQGSGYLAEKILEKIKKDRCEKAIVDSIRNPGEVESLKKNKDFILFAIDAPIEIRYKRIAFNRNRAGDNVSFEEFKRQEDIELKGESQTSQQLIEVFKRADFKIINNSSKNELKDKIEKILKVIKNGGRKT